MGVTHCLPACLSWRSCHNLCLIMRCKILSVVCRASDNNYRNVGEVRQVCLCLSARHFCPSGGALNFVVTHTPRVALLLLRSSVGRGFSVSFSFGYCCVASTYFVVSCHAPLPPSLCNWGQATEAQHLFEAVVQCFCGCL